MAKPKKKADTVSLSEVVPAADALATRAGVRTFSADDIEAAMSSGTAMPIVESLDEEGKGVRGLYQGAGAPVEFTDADGEVRTLATHVFKVAAGARVAIVGSHQLDHELPDLEGHEVTVIRGSQGSTRKGRRINRYLIVDHGAQ